MKKISLIALSALFIVNIFASNIYSSGYFNVYISNDVEGDIGSNISPQQVVLSFDDDNCAFITANLPSHTDVTTWFTYPTGCNYSAEVVNCTDDELTIQFTGNIDETATESTTAIEVVIPYNPSSPYIKYNSNPYTNDIDDVDNTDADFIINDNRFMIQYDGPYTVSGIVGEELVPQIVRVEITNGLDAFEVSIADPDLPLVLPVVNGLTPTATNIDETNLIITITYTGMPIDPSQDLIHTTIPKDYMTLHEEDRVVPDRNDVKFNIVPKEIPTPPVEYVQEAYKPTYTPPVTGIN